MNYRNESLRLHYTDSDPRAIRSSEETLILIHGFPHTSDLWREQKEALSSDFRVISYDVRGFGKSELGDGWMFIDFLVDDLIALMDHLRLDTCSLCGLSMGGYIALRAVERFPERFRGLVLCNTGSKADNNEAKDKRVDSVRLLRWAGKEAFIEDYVDGVFSQQALKRDPGVLERLKSMIRECSEDAIASGFMALASRPDTTASLAKISIPTLVIGGEVDPFLPATKQMQERIKGSKLKVIPKVGHLSNLEDPEAFNSHLSGFLRSLRKSASEKKKLSPKRSVRPTLRAASQEKGSATDRGLH
jgi:3-oxoadipate enol-lactonase